MCPTTVALSGLRVIDLSDGIAGAYCAHRLADAGAEVLRLEATPAGYLRRRSLSGSVGRDGHPEGALYRFLCAESQVITADVLNGESEQLLHLLPQCDVLIESWLPGVIEAAGLGHERLRQINEQLVMVSISPFGRGGPRSQEDAPDLCIQAMAGVLDPTRQARTSPLRIGGDVTEWAAGAYAALGTLTALVNRRRRGLGAHVDVSKLETAAVTLAGYPTLVARFPGTRQGLRATLVSTAFRCADGYVGLCPYTGQQWLDLFSMIERQDLADDPRMLDPACRSRRADELVAAVGAWVAPRRAAEIVDWSGHFRLPAAAAANGANLPASPQLRERGFYRPNSKGGFLEPASPFRFSWGPTEGIPPPAAVAGVGDHALPLDGLKVLDLTSFWAGPYATLFLASAGADVIKVEAMQRPDPMRLGSLVPPTDPLWYEKGAMFHATNLGKRDVTLDLTDTRGRALAFRLVAQSDMVVENFTPRVLDQLGMDYRRLAAVRPDLISIRMPAFGLEGPWRDLPGFAATIEMASGVAWTTGEPDGPPVPPGGICDPLAGVHAAIAALLALEERHRTGRGCQIEVSMLEVAATVTAEQVVEHSAYGALVGRTGNRHPSDGPQGVFRCSNGEWLAVAAHSDGQWASLRHLLGTVAPVTISAFRDVEGNLASVDDVDEQLRRWCANRQLTDAFGILEGLGITCALVAAADEIDRDPQMTARRFWQDIDHSVIGTHRFPGWPFTVNGDRLTHRGPAPLLGQHNRDILSTELGLSRSEINALRAAGVVGERLEGGA